MSADLPAEPGIYPVQVADGDGSHYDCAMWDGECWRLWCDAWDPPEWDVAEHLNSRVIRCAMPERAFDLDRRAPIAATTAVTGDSRDAVARRAEAEEQAKPGWTDRSVGIAIDKAVAEHRATPPAAPVVTDADQLRRVLSRYVAHVKFCESVDYIDGYDNDYGLRGLPRLWTDEDRAAMRAALAAAQQAGT